MNITEITFSPTGGTKRAARIVSSALAASIREIDLTVPDFTGSSFSLTDNDLCLIAVPSFGGRVPDTAAKRLRTLSGNGAKAILVVVYGNRAYEDTLLELQELLSAVGFSCIAAIAAVAEHSIMHQFAAGRPDAADQAELKSFAEKIREKLMQESSSPLSLPGNHPYKPYGVASMQPTTDSSCTGCGLCAAKCPVGAIVRNHPSATDSAACISCMRCIAICPNRARSLDPEKVAALTARLQNACSGRKENELFL